MSPRNAGLVATAAAVAAATVAVLAILLVAYSRWPAGQKLTQQEPLIPRPSDVCAPEPEIEPPGWHLWSGALNSNFTTTTRARLAPVPDQFWQVNPHTRLGVMNRVQVWNDPYGTSADKYKFGDPCDYAVSVYQVQPFETGFLTRKPNDSTDGTMAQQNYHVPPAYWSRAAGPYGGPYRPVATCPEDLGIDSDLVVFPSDDTYGAGAVARSLGSKSAAGKETLRSRGPDLPLACGRRCDAKHEPAHATVAIHTRCDIGTGCGLGSIWVDPRFDPGPRTAHPGGDIYSHGGHAGGPAFGTLAPASFVRSGTWSRYVRGYGDGRAVAPQLSAATDQSHHLAP